MPHEEVLTSEVTVECVARSVSVQTVDLDDDPSIGYQEIRAVGPAFELDVRLEQHPTDTMIGRQTCH